MPSAAASLTITGIAVVPDTSAVTVAVALALPSTTVNSLLLNCTVAVSSSAIVTVVSLVPSV